MILINKMSVYFIYLHNQVTNTPNLELYNRVFNHLSFYRNFLIPVLMYMSGCLNSCTDITVQTTACTRAT